MTVRPLQPATIVPSGRIARCIRRTSPLVWVLMLWATPELWGIAGGQAANARPTATTVASPAASSTPNERLILLIPTLTGDGAPADRRAAAAEILLLGTDEATKSLAGILGLKNNTAAKVAICEAVAEMDAPPTGLAEPLLSLLQSSREKEAQGHDAVVAALYRFTDPAVTVRLKAYLEQEERQWLRTENVARSRELYALLPRESDRVARLLTWLKAAQPLDRLTALEIVHSAMLAATPVPPAKEVLQQIRQMFRDPDENVRRKLVVVLRDLQEKEDAGRILGMIDHERSTLVLEEIYKALGRMGEPDSIQACIKGLNHPDEKVAAGAADALGRLCRKSNGKTPPYADAAVVALIAKSSTALTDDLRDQLTGAMAEIADPRFLPILIARAGPEEKLPQIRQAALTGIGQTGEPGNVDLVIARLSEDPDPGVREAAALALGKLGSKAAHLRPLVERLSETAATVQTQAWEAYRAIFARLPWAERLEILGTWTGKDKITTGRRIDLLTDLETQATSAAHDLKQLTFIREEMGDAFVVNTDYALAAAAYARALEGITGDLGPARIALTAKLMDAYLHVPAYEKAAGVASAVKSPQLQVALADRLLAYVRDLARVDPRAAVECIDRFRAVAPALFGAGRATDFEGVRRSATQPAATVPAN